MSKDGVKKSEEYRKPRDRAQLEERNGEVGKECTKCREWKSLSKYSKHAKCVGGVKSYCKECARIIDGSKKRQIPLSIQDGLIGKECSKCGEWKNLSEYRERKKYRGGRNSECRECEKIYALIKYEANKEECLENNRKWYKENRVKVNERNREYYNSDPEKFLLKEHKRLARKSSLPDTLTNRQYTKTLEYFGNACALTGKTENLEKEHAIPLSIGHGGTTFGNCYPMANGMNQSKGNKNIFEWFEANRQRFELSQERFDNLIAYLASANAMTVEEYRDYVYWCHANQRSIDEIKTNLEAN
jgi:hypothetical protein